MSKQSIKIISASYHRNGICGAGFYAIIFDDSKNGRMVASIFDESGYCAVYNIEELAKGNIEFARGNSWRGDDFEHELRPALEEYLEAQGDNRVGPFSVVPPDILDEVLKPFV